MPINTRGYQYGKIFGNWQIKKYIAGGSNGRTGVFQIFRDEAGWEEQCALKVITLISEQGSFETLSEFRKEEYKNAMDARYQQAAQEVRTMAQLRGNTNIVDYLDFSSSNWVEDDSFGCDMLIRMELLHDLRSQLKDGRSFTEKEIIKIGKDICTALILCHNRPMPILHRDIKPENIFVNEDGNYKLGDFGIAKIMDSCPGSMASTGIGTPEYAAPEQSSGKYDKRVDIYSLGLVLYELGNHNLLPFATSAYLDGKETVLRLSGKPLPAPTGVSPELANVILTACAFRPGSRYQRAEDMLNALNELDAPTRKSRELFKKKTKFDKNTENKNDPADFSHNAGFGTEYAGLERKQSAKDTSIAEKKAACQTQRALPAEQKLAKKPNTLLVAVGAALLVFLFAIGIIAIAASGTLSTDMQDNLPTNREMATACSTVLQRENAPSEVLEVEVTSDDLNEKFCTYTAECDVAVQENGSRKQYTVKLQYDYEDDQWVLSELSTIE